MKTRIVVLVNGQGSTSCQTVANYTTNAKDLTQRGFRPLASYNLPARCSRNKTYWYFVRWATHNWGI